MNAPHSSPLPAIACIGGGNMGQAIIAGLEQLPEPPAITVIDPSPQVADYFASHPHVHVCSDAAAVSQAEIVLLAVKPQMVADIASLYAPHLGPHQMLISILAGVTYARLRGYFPQMRCIVRSMPNTPMMVGSGMVGLCSDDLHDEDLQLAEAVFAPAAQTLRLPEDQFDALTAISGSGPAYVFHFAEGLHAAAQQAGLEEATARLLVRQTLYGAARFLMLKDQEADDFVASQLRQQVTSPGGTTAAALAVLEQESWNAHLYNAVVAAARRSQELRES